jgi:hypothetical protein
VLVQARQRVKGAARAWLVIDIISHAFLLSDAYRVGDDVVMRMDITRGILLNALFLHTIFQALLLEQIEL